MGSAPAGGHAGWSRLGVRARDRGEARSAVTVVDGYGNVDVNEIEFAAMEAAGERLPLLTLQEAHDLLHWLRRIAAECGAHAAEAGRSCRLRHRRHRHRVGHPTTAPLNDSSSPRLRQ
ncbi:hypothetical protein C3492_10410 [Streptomyces sp. Ru62]|uniref:DUF6417 family protein n=1 Tax=Streptomyces sp. Ru62 TaxID=2080745 RepID=UPI000D48464D|nr:hypothetical protein C3492_10410 [Streptomyces sp. Ru62]